MKPDCFYALQRKRRRNSPTTSEGTFSLIRFACKKSRIGGDLAQFRVDNMQISLHCRLCGGGGSLALTFLCPNSLLTGKITGNSRDSGPPRAHCFSLTSTFPRRYSVRAKNRAGNFQGRIRELSVRFEILLGLPRISLDSSYFGLCFGAAIIKHLQFTWILRHLRGDLAFVAGFVNPHSAPALAGRLQATE